MLLDMIRTMHDLWVGKIHEIRNPYSKNPSLNPNTNSGSNPRYAKLLRVIRVSDHGTRTTRNSLAQVCWGLLYILWKVDKQLIWPN